MNRQSQILSVAANGTTDWTFPTQLDIGSFVPDVDKMTLRFAATGAGAVGAVVTAYRGGLFGSTIIYDDTPAATFTLSGTASSAGSQAFEQIGSIYWRFVVSGITASTTVAGIAEWWQK